MNKSLSEPFGLKIILCILFIVALTTMSRSQTTIVAVRDSHQVVLAADSLAAGQGRTPTRFCKIRRCGTSFLAVAGLYEFGLSDNPAYFKMWTRLLADCRVSDSPRQQISRLQDSATHWIQDVLSFAKPRSNTGSEYDDYVRKKALLEIVIVGWHNDMSYIFYRSIGNIGDSLSKAPAKAMVLASSDYDGPIADNTVDEAILGHAEDLPPANQRASIYGILGLSNAAEFLVNFAIIAKPKDVGPPVDVLSVDKTGFHWVQRKADCDENKESPKPAGKRVTQKLIKH